MTIDIPRGTFVSKPQDKIEEGLAIGATVARRFLTQRTGQRGKISQTTWSFYNSGSAKDENMPFGDFVTDPGLQDGVIRFHMLIVSRLSKWWPQTVKPEIVNISVEIAG